ncbi:PREDICTED: chromatin modification-related protein EAF1 B-like isoform X1 [Lupinus angustifolius]|uniref:chromatin modification-related protein EAF1 B-like isoform X1 n=1 Tax=Lupinus angustifolius TaxID=3871 RepID=UPI00092F37D0|nr:PREDICTED: chromatin modification-related protein EAF1 B-like isoform X1 [Lupinus angustifolius]XP_019450095.1 PREDICTED: chromatin modification-related protein EAF1 B-like isoform X1 [Lupinus angustifolius]
MHGCSSESALHVNAEVDSMGGVVEGGVGIGVKTSPRRAAIDKAQAELRQEYDFREERRKQLEFLEKGGNPLDFKFGTAASVSVQSTSLTDQHHEQFVTSEAKGSFALTASPHGDSVDSSARPGALFNEPNTADNLLLFDGENELPEGKKRSLHSNKRNNIAPSEQCSQIGVSQNAKETEDSAIVRPYARRNRSRLNHGPRGVSRDVKVLVSDMNKQKDHNVPSSSKPKPASVNGVILIKDPASNNPLDNDMVGVREHQTASGSASVPEDKLDINFNRKFKGDQRILPFQDDTAQKPVVSTSAEAKAVEERDPGASADVDSLPYLASTQLGKEFCCGPPNGCDNIKLEKKGVPNEGQDSSAASGVKNFDSESSCAQTSLARDVNNDSDMSTNRKNVDANGNTMEKTLEFQKTVNLTGFEVVKERNKTNGSESGATVNYEHGSGYLDHSGNGNMVKREEDIHINSSCMENKVNDSSNIKGAHHNDSTISKVDKEDSIVVVDHSNSMKENSCERHQVPVDVSISETCQTALAENVTAAAPDCQPCSTHHLKFADKAHEDSILEEAQIIKVKRKRIAELSLHALPTQSHRKSHWGFVLEEMAWLANDFAQERLWKLTAAAQLCHRASISSRLRVEKQNKLIGRNILSHNMAKAVMQFWHSVELLLDNNDHDCSCIGGSVKSEKDDSNEASEEKRKNSDMVLKTSKYLEGQNPRKNTTLKVHAYALRFLKDNRSCGIPSQVETPTTPDKISDSCTVDMSWEDQLTEENLFYTVPPTAMEAYRKSVESHFLQFEKTGSSIQEEVETSMYDTAAEFRSEEITYDEDEGETGYYLPGVYVGSRSSKSVHKKHKHRMKSYTHKSSEVGTDLAYAHYTSGTQPSAVFVKRPASLNVGAIPTKRMRTASRQRVVSPFAVATGTVQTQTKTDASSGDTNSFQDDQSTLHVGSQIQKSVEVESVGDFEKQLPYDCGETSVKTKRKKPKTMGSAYDQGWQLESVPLNEQRDHSKNRLDNYHFESNGSSGLYGQHNVKKLKTMKQSLDNSSDNIAPITSSIPSPAASQISNMSNPSKFIRIISGRDRGRKAKGQKISAGQPGSGTIWSLFEDQALVVLVHDMGPNWELVSDAINSSLQFKCIYRKPNECKERHKILMDRSAGDGADSAEDSGSSQSYPSTLPGIPKGSAMQLFQRLQGPMEEDTLKSHFDKIIKIGQKQHYRRNQNNNQDLKQLVPIHNSHVIALSQVFPNNLNGGVLTPHDLCDTNATNPDGTTTGCQGSHAAGLGLSNHGSVPSAHPTSGPNSSNPLSSGMTLGNNLSSPSAPMAASIRDNKYGVARTSPLTVDEHERIQQYNQMISARNMQQSGISVPGSVSGSDRGVHVLPGGSGMGMVGGINRNIAMSRPGYQGMSSSSMHGSGGMLSSSMVGVPSPVHMHPGVVAGQGNSIPRPREAVHMRPGHNQEHHRQMMVPESQMQATQGNSQSNPAFNGMSSAFNNQTVSPHAQQPQQQSHLSNPRPHLQGQNHATSSQQQAHAIRMAKERQLRQQQRYRQHQLQQKQFSTSNAMVPHVPAQSQHPISSPLQNNSQAKPQNSSQQVSLPPVTSSSPSTPMSSQQHHLPQHGFSRNPGASGLTNQAVKPRQPQQRPYQQSGRQHLNQPLHAQSQQQAKLLKGIGRGNMSVHQNPSVDPSHLNGLSVPPGSQTVEKGDQIMHMMQGQNLHSGPANPSSKQLQSVASPSDNSIQGQASAADHIMSPPQPAAPAANHHQLQQQSQPQSKQINQTRANVQRLLQKNCQSHSETSSMSRSDSPQVDQHPANCASDVSTSTAMSPGCLDSASVVTVIPTVSSQWKTSEPPFDSKTPNPVTHMSSLGGAAVGNSADKELPTISQGLGPQQLSGSLTSHTRNSVVHRQPPPLQKQSSLHPILSQQSYQPPEQQQKEQEQHSPEDAALQHQPQQKVQNLQPGQNSLLVRPPNSKAE